MSSVLKPSLTASVPQNSAVPSQLNKPMHPQQGPPQSYGQPSNHHPIMSHGNPTAAHNHPATHQPNHYSLNVPNASGHYMGNNQPIPASNHPVPNNPSQPPAQQIYGGAKNMAFQGGYQPNLGHPPNQAANQLPPVSQSLPATNSQPGQHHTEEPADRSSHSNGTNDEKTNSSQENHVTTPKEISNTPTVPAQLQAQNKTSSPERPADSQKNAEQDKPIALNSSNVSTSASTTENSGTQESPRVSEPAEKASSTPDKDGTDSANNDVSDIETEEDSKSNETNEDANSSTVAEEKDDDKKEVEELESAHIPADGDKSKSEAAEPDSKEKSVTPKSRAPTRKPSRVSRNDEDSPKTPRSEPKPSGSQKSPSTSKSKRARIRTQPYQSPLPELEIISKISASSSQRNKTNDDKLIVFFKNEFLAVRNSEGSFYICQAVQNVYKSSAKIRIRWLSLDVNDKNNQIYTPDFYDNTDFDCILTNLNLERIEKGKFKLPAAEKERTDSILNRSLAAEKGEDIPSPTVTEEHPDGLDLSLYKDENQLSKQKGKKRKATSPVKSPRSSSRTPVKKAPETPKVAKVAPSSTKKSTKKEAPTPAKKVTPTFATTPKKSSGSRTERAKRRSDNTINSTKVSPVSPKVDQKKAKALAKVARKSAVSTPKPPTPVKKESKPSKSATPAKPKTAVKVTPPTSTKKNTPKRSLRK